MPETKSGFTSELAFIDWLRAELAATHAPNRDLPLPPGDDTAAVRTPSATTLFAADMLMDGVHFDLRQTPPALAGRKALAVNLSDIAAMAGTPTSITVCLALPRRGGAPLAKAVSRGLLDLAAEYGVALAGGDTNAWDGPLVISVAILGTPHPRGNVTRAGAQVGDQICVTGRLGGSLGGRHLTFAPRVREAQMLHGNYGLTAMIDLSDGLGSDLRHVMAASGTAARLTRAEIPLNAASTLTQGLNDGEDFELCFTLPEAAASCLLREQPLGVPVTCIGTVTAAAAATAATAATGVGRLVWDDGTPVTESGYQHRFD